MVTAPVVESALVRVPASTANLGSGFDTLGMALAMYDVVDVRVLDAGLTVQITGEGEGWLPRSGRHLVVRALHAAAAHLRLRLPGLRVRCHNVIPHSRGLGSSAAAVVAGVAAAYHIAGRPLDDAALRLAADFEGHADNAAASLSGGLVIAWRDEAGQHAVRAEPHPALRPVALVPATTSATKTTRGLLPETVPHADAAFAASRAALAVHALTEAPQLLLAATDDRLHQDYRESAWPASMRLVRGLRAHGVPAAISGAGPTVLAFPGNATLPVDVDIEEFSIHRLEVDREGVQVE